MRETTMHIEYEFLYCKWNINKFSPVDNMCIYIVVLLHSNYIIYIKRKSTYINRYICNMFLIASWLLYPIPPPGFLDINHGKLLSLLLFNYTNLWASFLKNLSIKDICLIFLNSGPSLFPIVLPIVSEIIVRLITTNFKL